MNTGPDNVPVQKEQLVEGEQQDLSVSDLFLWPIDWCNVESDDCKIHSFFKDINITVKYEIL